MLAKHSAVLKKHGYDEPHLFAAVSADEVQALVKLLLAEDVPLGHVRKILEQPPRLLQRALQLLSRNQLRLAPHRPQGPNNFLPRNISSSMLALSAARMQPK